MTHLEDLLTLKEAAPLARCSAQTLRDAIRAGELQSVKPGREKLVTKQWIEDWLTKKSVNQPTNTL